ncbi:MAG: type 1 glutamine amidotransferase-like domain-containing protein [Candidatus Riflebacteria bacterium]|nr:type 1 glutamine amidotransferase-like domain-containing protein [Candidatus Riflebacteria bacterium]
MKHHPGTRFWALLLLMTAACGVATAGPPLALIGGGRVDFTPGSWSDGIGRWIVGHANGGRILVLTTLPLVDELPRWLRHLGAAEADLLEIPNRYRADAPELYRAIATAEGLVLPDGQAWRMIQAWRGTRTESAIRDHLESGRVLAGFGTGAMVMGGVIPDRRHGVLTATEALRLPGTPRLTFTDDFLQALPGTLVEPAFLRDGRLPALLLELAARRQAAPGLTLAGIGIDERTALVIDPDGTATVLGEGAVAVLATTASTALRLDPRLPPVITDVQAALLTAGFVLDPASQQIVAAPPTAVPAYADVPAGPWTARDIDGSSEEAAAAGEVQVTQHTHESLALQLGLLHQLAGRREIPWTVIMPNAFAAPELAENRVGGLFWALARKPGLVGILLDQGGKAEITPTGVLFPLPLTGQPATLVVDSRQAILRDFPSWTSWPDSVGPRQSVALVGLRLHLLASRWGFALPSGAVLPDR